MRAHCATLIALLALLGQKPARTAEIVFADVTRAAGLLEPLVGIMGHHGGAWSDFDGDERDIQVALPNGKIIKRSGVKSNQRLVVEEP